MKTRRIVAHELPRAKNERIIIPGPKSPFFLLLSWLFPLCSTRQENYRVARCSSSLTPLLLRFYLGKSLLRFKLPCGLFSGAQ